MVEIIDAINHKLYGQYPTNWWGRVYNMIWNSFDRAIVLLKQHDLEQF